MPEVSDSSTTEETITEKMAAREAGRAGTHGAPLRLLIETEPWSRTFGLNLRDLFSDKQGDLPPLQLESAPATFWPDVFVDRKLPWRRFLESGGYHVLAIIAIWGGSRFLALQPHAVPQSQFTHADVVYYSAADYLPPIDTLKSHGNRPRANHSEKADPGFSSQPVISVPPESDNRSQTIVAAPAVRLKHDIKLPNSVAWSDAPRMPIAPAPLVPASQISRLAPQLERSVVAPPPSVEKTERQSQSMRTPELAVVAPPPALDATSNRRIGDMNIGRSAVIAPAPQLSVAEQRTMPRAGAALHGNGSQVIAPPPSLGASGRSRSGGAMVALSLNPAVGAPPPAVAGNRRGTFSSTPSGHRGASGASADSDASGTSGKNSNSKLPSGLYVGNNSGANSVNPNLIANARPPRVTRTETSTSAGNISEAEREVFGDRKIYSLSLNMPNLNSGGGSWIIRFAPLAQDASKTQEQVSSPVATSKVDPAYPLELMRQNVQGTVILYGVIHADGSVSQVRVLRSVDARLDHFASDAISKWKFQPAMKAGTPVDVEATFWIPFRPTKSPSQF
jgi:TonB family protein